MYVCGSADPAEYRIILPERLFYSIKCLDKPLKRAKNKFFEYPDGKVKRWGSGRYPSKDLTEWDIVQMRGSPKIWKSGEELLKYWRIHNFYTRRRAKQNKAIESKVKRISRRTGRRPTK